MVRVLVTGGAGFIGSHAAEALIERGDRVTIVDNFDPFYDPAIKKANLDELRRRGSFDFVEADIRDRPRMQDVFREGDFDLVVHLAAKAGVRPSIEDPSGYVSVNLDGSAAIFDLAIQENVSRVVFSSSSSVYGNNRKVPFSEKDPVDHPVSPYAATKKAGELLAHTYHHLHGLSVTCLRLFTVYGPRQRPEMAIHKFTRLIEEGRPIPFFGDGASRRDYTYVGDVVGGLVRAADQCDGYRVYNLGESRTTTLASLVAILENALGKKAILDRQPFQPGDVQDTSADISLATAEIGYAPSTTVEEGIPMFVDWFRSRRG